MVIEGDVEGRRDLWLPGLVGLVGVLMALTVWGLQVAERRAQILASSAESAAETREAVELYLAQQIAALEGLARQWRRFGLSPLAEWTADVDERVERIPGLQSVAWVDLDDPRSRVASGREPSQGEIEIDVDEARGHYEAPHLGGPERNDAGAVIYRVFLPVRTPGDQAGVLVARVDVAAFLGFVLQARVPGHALAVSWDGQPVFSRGVASSDRNQHWWRVEETVDLPFGGHWRIVQRPTPELAAARLTPLPHYLLGAGVVLSGVLALVAHQLRVIVRQARFLAVSNRALEARGTELESKVSQRTRDLEEAIAELEAFNYSVSHDLRSPLGAILNFAAILEEDYCDRPLDPAGLGLLARIRRSATRATDLLEDLLRLSRAGRDRVEFERIDMTALAREAFAQARAAEPDAEVEFLIDPLPPAVGDRNLLRAVFQNLFSNALKYSRGCEKRRVHVGGRTDDDVCVYDVADNGQGFDARFAEKVFGVFERLHSAEDVEGTGVGLALVARIVRRHGGRVWADGTLGQGARFSFSLPRRETA